MIKDYIENIDSILKNGNIEKIKIERTNLLKDIIFNSWKFSDKLFIKFIDNFYNSNFNFDDLIMKTQDMIYRINLIVNKLLIPKYNFDNAIDISSLLLDIMEEEDLDFYSAVSYDDNDKEIIEEFDSVITNNIKI